MIDIMTGVKNKKFRCMVEMIINVKMTSVKYFFWKLFLYAKINNNNQNGNINAMKPLASNNPVRYAMNLGDKVITRAPPKTKRKFFLIFINRQIDVRRRNIPNM